MTGFHNIRSLVTCRISRRERRKRQSFQPTSAFPSLRLKISPGWTIVRVVEKADSCVSLLSAGRGSWLSQCPVLSMVLVLQALDGGCEDKTSAVEHHPDRAPFSPGGAGVGILGKQYLGQNELLFHKRVGNSFWPTIPYKPYSISTNCSKHHASASRSQQALIRGRSIFREGRGGQGYIIETLGLTYMHCYISHW